ncbi:Uncharacterised protein [Vibrio cholerae]|nr:Uncharacterised protein [Vibrio cholerae]
MFALGWGDHRFPRHHRNTFVGQIAEGFRQLNTAHFQCAGVKIVVQYRNNLIVEIAKRTHQIGNRGVAITVHHLRSSNDFVISNERLTAELAYKLQQTLTRCREATLQHVAHHNRAGIDKWITRNSMLHLKLN